MKRFIHRQIMRFKRIPLSARISIGVFLGVIMYVGVFIIPTNVQFSYATKETCIPWVTIAPTIAEQRAGKDDYTVTLGDKVSIFGTPVLSRSACITPSKSPNTGLKKVSVAPFGLPIFSKTFNVNAPAMPTAQVATLHGVDVSAVRPLVVPLSSADSVHVYSLRYGDKSAECTSVKESISCAINQLNLSPSTSYDLELYRGYEKTVPEKIETISIHTLTAVQLVESSVKNDATIYDKPTAFTFTFDRQVDSVQALLERTDGTASKIEATFTAEGTKVIVTPKQALARSASYTLTLKQVISKDGGSLVDPIVTNFTLSGGPKVTSVSIGSSLVPQNAKVIVTFDQPIKADADLAKFARASGVNAPVSRVTDNSIAFSVTDAALCTAFTLTIDKGLPSGSNDEVSTDAWQFNSRIICGYASTIGYSVKGRAIISYTFGTGASTILYTGGIHGSEPSGMSTMQAWVNYLQSYGYKIPADKKVVIVPNTNPDGIAAGTRYNANNVNLDRNFPASNWRPDIDTASGILPTGGGTSAGSEPETQALLALVRQLRPRLEVSFHAQGSLVGANQFGDSTPIGETYAAMVGYATMIGNAEEVMGYSITGEFEDWMGQELTIPAILIELPTPSGNYLNSQLNALLKTLVV